MLRASEGCLGIGVRFGILGIGAVGDQRVCYEFFFHHLGFKRGPLWVCQNSFNGSCRTASKLHAMPLTVYLQGLMTGRTEGALIIAQAQHRQQQYRHCVAKPYLAKKEQVLAR